MKFYVTELKTILTKRKNTISPPQKIMLHILNLYYEPYQLKRFCAFSYERYTFSEYAIGLRFLNIQM